MDGGVDAELPASHFPQFLLWGKQWTSSPKSEIKLKTYSLRLIKWQISLDSLH